MGSPKGRFQAVSVTGETIDKSLQFKIDFRLYSENGMRDIYESPQVRQALGELVGRLTSIGWQLETNKGKYWYSYVLRR